MRVAVTSTSMGMSVAVVTVTVTFVLMGVTSSSMGMTVVATAAVGMAVTCPTVLTKKKNMNLLLTGYECKPVKRLLGLGSFCSKP